jgi:hypothetical protein
LASSKNAFDHQQTDTHGEKENENYHYHHRHPRRHTSRRKKKKKEYKATTEDGLKEKKLHDTEKEKMCTSNGNLPFCRSLQLS